MRSWQVLKRVIEAARDQSGFEDEGKSSRNGRGRREKKGGEIKALILSLIFVEGSAFDLFFLSLDPLSALFLSLSLSFSLFLFSSELITLPNEKQSTHAPRQGTYVRLRRPSKRTKKQGEGWDLKKPKKGKSNNSLSLSPLSLPSLSKTPNTKKKLKQKLSRASPRARPRPSRRAARGRSPP